MKFRHCAALLTGALLVFAAGASVVHAADSAVVTEAEKKFNAGDFSGVITILRPATAQDPSNAAAFYWLGRSYYETRDYENAASSTEKAVALAPKTSAYHQWLGRAYGAKADRDHSFFLAKKVKSELAEAVRLDPSNIEARFDLEDYCMSAPWIVGGSKDEAQAQVDAIAAIDPVEGHVAHGLFAKEALKKPADAEAEFRKVLDAKPAHIGPYFEVANFFINANKPADLDATIKAMAAVAQADARLAYYRGVQAVLAGGNSAEAERELKSYIASTADRSDWPSHASAREWLGRLYESQGNATAAAEQYRAALQLEPNRKATRDRLNKLERDSH